MFTTTALMRAVVLFFRAGFIKRAGGTLAGLCLSPPTHVRSVCVCWGPGSVAECVVVVVCAQRRSITLSPLVRGFFKHLAKEIV